MSNKTTSTFKGPHTLNKRALGEECVVTMLGPEELAEFNLGDITLLSVTIIPSPGAVGDVIFHGHIPGGVSAPMFPVLPHCEHIEDKPIYSFFFMGLCSWKPLTIAKVMQSGDVVVLLKDMLPESPGPRVTTCDLNEDKGDLETSHPIIPFPNLNGFVDWDSFIRSINSYKLENKEL